MYKSKRMTGIIFQLIIAVVHYHQLLSNLQNNNQIQSLTKSSSIFWNFSWRSGGTSMSWRLSWPISSSVLYSNTKTNTTCQSYGTKNPNNNNTDLECTLNRKEKREDRQGCSENTAKQRHIRNQKTGSEDMWADRKGAYHVYWCNLQVYWHCFIQTL